MLTQNLKTLLATQFSYFLKAQFFHWNVEGPNFSQLHDFFGMLYQDAYSAIDPIAEYIRTLDEYAPGSLSVYSELTLISDQKRVKSPKQMLQEMLDDNQIMIQLLKETFADASADGEEGIGDFISGRISAHGKWDWQLKAYLKNRERL